jgi:NO-binding membrane sensor protein with MHYT domain/two-component sensor histidine kinase
MTGAHNPWLVLLSVVVAIMASFVALELGTKVASPYRRVAARRLWIVGGAVAMGTGIWSMHFIGMLGFHLPVEVSFEVPITLVSLLIAIAAAGFALLLTSRKAMGIRRLIWGGLLMGIAIAGMHYVGMAAMRMEPPIRYTPVLLALSVIIAVAASVMALWSAFELRLESIASAFWKKAGSALVMGSGIYGMHYTGMAAAQFAPEAVSAAGPPALNPLWFAVTLGAFTLLYLTATLLVAAFDAYLAFGETQRLSRRLVEVQDAERRSLAAELHDVVGQDLAAANAELAILKTKIPPAYAEAAEKVSMLLSESVDSIRSVMVQLRPPGLDELGLGAALRWHAEVFEGRTGIPVDVRVTENLPKPSPEVEDALLRIYLEALNNAAKHANANAVSVRLERRDGRIGLSIADDGSGFDPSPPVRQDQKSGWGLMIMRERAAAVGGDLRIESAAGKGTRIEFVIPEDRWQ